MNILHVNQSDISGGAAIASYRLHQSLISHNIDSTLLVDQQKVNSDHVIQLQRKRTIEELLLRLPAYLGLNYISIFSSFQINRLVCYKNANLLNFHNLHSGYFNYLSIVKLTQAKPAVYTLHDMWSFTGHCAYSFDCQKWKTGCGECPYPDAYPPIKYDNTALEWKLKSWVYKRSNLTIVCPSQWLADQAQQSMLNRFTIHHIPHGINTQNFKPIDTNLCRQVLNVPPNKKVILFGAQGLKDLRKGGDLLLEALKQLPQSLKQDLLLLTFGDGGENFQALVDIPVLGLGYISGDRLKSIAYSAADLFIFPTRADIFGLVLLESMTCSTPIVSFNVNAVPELVRPGVTGLLAKPEDAKDLSLKIIELLEDDILRKKMAQRCREIAVTEYSIELQAKRYIEVYRQTIDAFHNS